MNSDMNRSGEYVTSRLIVFIVCVIIIFSILIVKLFRLQIVMGEFLQNQVVGTTLKEITVKAPRGSIYDRYGRPLAVNTSSFTVNLDPSVQVDDLNAMLLDLSNLLTENKEDLIDDFPISKERPYIFLFNGDDAQEKRWKADMDLEESLTAEEAFYKLRSKFDIDKNLSDEDARKILSLRSTLYEKRFSQFIPITVAYNIKKETIGAIEERKSSFPCVYIDVEALRTYPSGKYLSHILGYIRGITASELETYEQYGYTMNDIIGKDGIEKSFELELNGTDGKKYVEVDSLGRRINTVEDNYIDPIPGNKVFLTIDIDLQKAAYDALENALKNAIVSRLTGGNSKFGYGSEKLFTSMLEADTIRMSDILKSTPNTVSYALMSYVTSVDPEALHDTEKAREIIIEGLKKNTVSQRQLVQIMLEQGTISGDDAFKKFIMNDSYTPSVIIINKIRDGEITPQMTNLDPCTGSIVVTDINNGDILAAVTYPSYDNNYCVNNVDNEDYARLQKDPTTPLVNRPFTEPRAPGSTFKMITSIAGLEEGYITPYTTIYDKGTFTDAGYPYANCWIAGSYGGSHGSINVSHALEVSCNYFFYDLSYRMGNSKYGGTEKGIKTLNKYMELFGLNDSTGVEIYELYDSMEDYPTKISSPEYKEFLYHVIDPDMPESDLKWYDGDTIRTAIGQCMNNYTAANMAKYVNTLANGGKRYPLHFLNEITTNDGKLVRKYNAQPELVIDIKPENLQAVYEGMYLVTSGSNGTLTNHFRNYPIKVAAKSGTAEQVPTRSEHTTFV
ncbi:MAG: hypothetical protein IJ736_04685, partial [Firmicutes bacterium]|nr:hypothetical protein [Bacillota bacterium]